MAPDEDDPVLSGLEMLVVCCFWVDEDGVCVVVVIFGGAGLTDVEEGRVCWMIGAVIAGVLVVRTAAGEVDVEVLVAEEVVAVAALGSFPPSTGTEVV